MENKIANPQNSRFFKVLEEIKKLLSIITGTVLEEAQSKQNLEYFEQIATSKEDIKTVQELKESLEHLDKKAKSYRNSIGTNTTNIQKQKSQNSKNTTNTHTLNKSQNTINTSISIDQNSIEHNDSYDMEL